MKRLIYLLILVSIIGGFVICKLSYSEDAPSKTSLEELEESSLDKHTKEDKQNKKEIEGAITSPLLPIINEDITLSETLV
ncbi:MAG: hypothetical protein NC925_01275 [Candidatus Omnitrophica bacterium]|nr:hypothetical protein [Candidatus Omnitrophota bacterium]